jgi:hypothetical protein
MTDGRKSQSIRDCKVHEVGFMDHAIYAAGQLVSGTLKHLARRRAHSGCSS